MAFKPHFLAAGLLTLAVFGARGQDSERSDWLKNPAMGNYKAYAEFKMGHYRAARTVWETLAEVGNGDALFNLGVLAEDGLGEPSDMAKALSLYTSAAAAANFKAQYRLGLLYFAGTLIPQDLVQARLYLTQAAIHGDADAREMLARIGTDAADLPPLQQADLLSGGGKHALAAIAYQKLADAGSAVAQTRLAWAYEAGRGVPKDLGEAARRFEIAAHQGEADAQYALAVMLRTGKGRPTDLPLSEWWLSRAAAQNHPAAIAAMASAGNRKSE